MGVSDEGDKLCLKSYFARASAQTDGNETGLWRGQVFRLIRPAAQMNNLPSLILFPQPHNFPSHRTKSLISTSSQLSWCLNCKLHKVQNVVWNVMQMSTLLMWFMKAEIYLVRQASLLCGRSLTAPLIRVELGGLSISTCPFLGRGGGGKQSTYPVTINSCCYAFNTPRNYNFLTVSTGQFCCLTYTCSLYTVIWSTAVLNYTLKSRWGNNAATWRHSAVLSYRLLRPELLVCRCICDRFARLECLQLSRADVVPYADTAHTHTHTHTRTPFNSSDDTSYTSHPLLVFAVGKLCCSLCVLTSLSNRYEVTLWTVTAQSVQTCWLKLKSPFCQFNGRFLRGWLSRDKSPPSSRQCVDIFENPVHIQYIWHSIWTPAVPQRVCLGVRSLVRHQLTFPVMKEHDTRHNPILTNREGVWRLNSGAFSLPLVFMLIRFLLAL